MENKGKILIVDDEPELVDLIKMRLEANNYEVSTASNGEEGFDKALKEKPNLIILDVLMPKKDGYTFVREARREESLKNTPIIILTAKPGMKDLFEVEGITDYVIKPFEPKELLEKINKHFK